MKLILYERKFNFELSAFYGIEIGVRLAKWRQREYRGVFSKSAFSHINPFIKNRPKMTYFTTFQELCGSQVANFWYVGWPMGGVKTLCGIFHNFIFLGQKYIACGEKMTFSAKNGFANFKREKQTAPLFWSCVVARKPIFGMQVGLGVN